MHTRVLASLAFAAALLAGAAQAQQPTPPAQQTPPANPLDAIPDQMPFNVPYGAPITADRARAVISAAAEEAKKRGWPMNISVVDSGGNLVAFERMDGAQLASIAISEHKARAAAKFRRETKIFENGMQLSTFRYIATLDDVIASRGGIPLIEGGKLIGAVGCSGGTGSQDEAIAKVAAAVINK